MSGGSKSSSSTSSNTTSKNFAGDESIFAEAGAEISIDSTSPEAFKFGETTVDAIKDIVGDVIEGAGHVVNSAQQTSSELVNFAKDQGNSEWRGLADGLVNILPWIALIIAIVVVIWIWKGKK